MALKWNSFWRCPVQCASAMFVMYSDKNRQYTSKAPDGTAIKHRSKRDLHLNRASAHHFHNNNKAAALFPVTSEEKCHILIPFFVRWNKNETSRHFLLLLQSTAQVKQPQISLFLRLRTWRECEVCKVKRGCETVCACVCVCVCVSARLHSACVCVLAD